MNLYSIKCLMLAIKHNIDDKFNFYSGCNDWSFKNFANIDIEELSDLLKDLI